MLKCATLSRRSKCGLVVLRLENAAGAPVYLYYSQSVCVNTETWVLILKESRWMDTVLPTEDYIFVVLLNSASKDKGHFLFRRRKKTPHWFLQQSQAKIFSKYLNPKENLAVFETVFKYRLRQPLSTFEANIADQTGSARYGDFLLTFLFMFLML